MSESNNWPDIYIIKLATILFNFNLISPDVYPHHTSFCQLFVDIFNITIE